MSSTSLIRTDEVARGPEAARVTLVDVGTDLQTQPFGAKIDPSPSATKTCDDTRDLLY